MKLAKRHCLCPGDGVTRFLASDDSSLLTGAARVVDGGGIAG